MQMEDIWFLLLYLLIFRNSSFVMKMNLADQAKIGIIKSEKLVEDSLIYLIVKINEINMLSC